MNYRNREELERKLALARDWHRGRRSARESDLAR
jgi:hypothetical protein